ncbi:hypothetical protein ACQ4LE_005879 [Meloidogyne hapla]
MGGLQCDVCKQDISLGSSVNPTICLFPCFHKYCERCKAQVLATVPQHGAESRVSCKLCNQQFLLNVLYDYSENMIEKIFCLHCNIKNKATVEWRCKSCQNRYLCAHCSQPHYHSGHELEPVMKPNLPLRSQCSAHSNILATYLCSCQARLCDYCLNNHADGSVEHPHEQRIAYNKLAERARVELDTIRRQSQRDFEKLERLREKVTQNKAHIGNQATQARTAIANEVVELVNTIIRRGNDIVTCIDLAEETKTKNCGQLEKEMVHWTERLKKIESFTENALLTVQQDHPGMWSASMFAQSALFQVNKRRDLAKNTLESFERLPIIAYQNGSTNDLFSAIRSFGLLNLDGEIKLPAQSTPQNAQMFPIANNFHQYNIPNNIPSTSDTPIQNKRPNPPTQNVPPILRSSSQLNASTSRMDQQQHQVNVSVNIQPLQQQQRIITPVMNLSSPPPNIQHIPTSIHAVPQQQHNIPVNSHAPMTLQTDIFNSVSSPSGIIPHLLQHPMNISASRPQLLPTNCPLPANIGSPISMPNTPLTPVMNGPDQMQFMRQNAMTMALQQQQQHVMSLQQNQHQQQRIIQQQQPQQNHQLPQRQQMRMQIIPQHSAGLMPHQIQQNIVHQIQQNISLPHQQLFNQPHQQPHIIQNQQQHQQMQQHQQHLAAQRHHQQHQQMIIPQQYHPQVMSPPFQQHQQPQAVQVLDSPPQQQMISGQQEERHPPIMLRIPNPRQNAQQFVDSVIGQPSTSSADQSQIYQNSGTTPLEHLVEMTCASSMPQTSRNLGNINDQPTNIPQKQSSTAAPEIVDLLDDEEEEQRNSHKQTNLESTSNQLTVPIVNDVIVNSEKLEKINSLQQQDSLLQQSQNNPHLLKALRQNKPQSVAADSTVSFAGNHSSTESPIPPINTNSGTKRKPASANINDNEHKPTEKRLATEIDKTIILNNENNLNEEEKQRQINISPPADLISTTTAENGEEDFDKEENNNNILEQKLAKKSRKSETPNSLDLRVFSSPEENNGEASSQPEKSENSEKILSKNLNNSKTGKWATTKPSLNEGASSGNNTNKSKPEENIKNSENVGNKAEESSAPTGDDFWDDYCYVCSQGCDETTGSLGCCESCPKVFHAQCHVPRILGLMEDLPDDWRCSVCVECEPLTQQSQEFGNREQLLCAKVFLACFEDNSQVELFVNQVPPTETDYHNIIKHPIWLQLIGERINFKSYANVSKFLDDMNLLFQNFSTFNSPTDPLASKGKSVYLRYIEAVKKFMPFYIKQIWVYYSLHSSRFNSTQTTSSLNVPTEDDNNNEHNRNRLKGTTVGRKRGGSKAKSQTPA